MIRAEGDSYWMEFTLPFALRPFVIPKGSVTLDGISLTMASLTDRDFGVGHSAHVGTYDALGSHTGATVNIEADVLGKYVSRMMSLQNLPV